MIPFLFSLPLYQAWVLLPWHCLSSYAGDLATVSSSKLLYKPLKGQRETETNERTLFQMLSNTSTPSCTFFSTLSISPWSFRVAPMTPLKDSQTPSPSHFQPPFPNTLPQSLDHAKGWRLLQRLQSLSVLIVHLLPTPPFFAIELPKASITSTLALQHHQVNNSEAPKPFPNCTALGNL